MRRLDRKKTRRTETWMMLIVALGLVPLGLYTGYLAWLAYDEPRTFQEAPILPASGGERAKFYKTAGEIAGAFLTPPLYPEVTGALQYQVSRERKDDGGDGWTQTGIVQAERVPTVRVGTVDVQVTSATRVLGEPTQRLRPLGPEERLKITWTKGQGEHYVAYGVFDGSRLAEGRFQRVFLATAKGERELLELMNQSAWIKALVLGVVGVLSLLMAGFAVRSALR